MTNRGFQTQNDPAGPEEPSLEEAKKLRKEHAHLKTKLDSVNKAVNVDWILHMTTI